MRAGHETKYASIGNNYFFTKSCHPQIYQNYEQSRQKLGTFLENKVFQKSKFSKKIFFKVCLFLSPIFFSEKKLERFDQFSILKNNFEIQNFKTFEDFIHTFGRSDNDII